MEKQPNTAVNTLAKSKLANPKKGKSKSSVNKCLREQIASGSKPMQHQPKINLTSSTVTSQELEIQEIEEQTNQAMPDDSDQECILLNLLRTLLTFFRNRQIF